MPDYGTLVKHQVVIIDSMMLPVALPLILFSNLYVVTLAKAMERTIVNTTFVDVRS